MYILSWYECPKCGGTWVSLWDSACDDDCPSCGERSITPIDYEQVDEDSPTMMIPLVLVKIYGDVEYFAVVINRRNIESGASKEKLSDLFTSVGFRNIRDGESSVDYMRAFWDFQSKVTEGYFEDCYDESGNLDEENEEEKLIAEGCDLSLLAPDKWQIRECGVI